VNDKKAVYIAPELTVHGDLAEITQNNMVLNLQDTLGQPPPVVGSNFEP
jgi:hypothetical protein